MKKYITRGREYLVKMPHGARICQNKTAAGMAYTRERSRKARLAPDIMLLRANAGAQLELYGTLDELRPMIYGASRKLVPATQCKCCGQARRVWVLSERGRLRLEKLRRKREPRT